MEVKLIPLSLGEYIEKAIEVGLPKVCFYWRLVRAFQCGNKIYVMDVFKNNTTLIAHELGHVKGLEHTWQPSIMNPCGLFRWFISPEESGLIEKAKELIKKCH